MRPQSFCTGFVLLEESFRLFPPKTTGTERAPLPKI